MNINSIKRGDKVKVVDVPLEEKYNLYKSSIKKLIGQVFTVDAIDKSDSTILTPCDLWLPIETLIKVPLLIKISHKSVEL